MQLGTDLSTSQVEYNFIGTGFVLVAQKVPPPSADMFVIKTNVFLLYLFIFRRLNHYYNIQGSGVRSCVCVH